MSAHLKLPRLFNPFAFARRRFRQWLQTRLPLTDTLTLTQRNVYILPTRPGFMLAITLMALLVASINYQLNLGYLLTFLLAGSAVVGMHVCHGTLRGLSMRLIAPEPQFMGTSATMDVNLVNERRSTRYSIGLAVLDATHEDRWTWTDVPAQGAANVQVAFKPIQRGLQHVPPLTAETRFPLGTFRVWTVWRPAAQVLVYPMPEHLPPPLPPGEAIAGGAAALRSQNSGEFDGVRAYQRGDPLKLVVWKKAAKSIASGSDDLVSRDTQQAQRWELWLDFSHAGRHGNASQAADLEHRLSRLCAWVLQADKLDLHYGLRLPGREISPASGEAHRRRCLEALALC
jgi:uncharacterized protein (DUF58 family)